MDKMQLIRDLARGPTIPIRLDAPETTIKKECKSDTVTKTQSKYEQTKLRVKSKRKLQKKKSLVIMSKQISDSAIGKYSMRQFVYKDSVLYLPQQKELLNNYFKSPAYTLVCYSFAETKTSDSGRLSEDGVYPVSSFKFHVPDVGKKRNVFCEWHFDGTQSSKKRKHRKHRKLLADEEQPNCSKAFEERQTQMLPEHDANRSKESKKPELKIQVKINDHSDSTGRVTNQLKVEDIVVSKYRNNGVEKVCPVWKPIEAAASKEKSSTKGLTRKHKKIPVVSADSEIYQPSFMELKSSLKGYAVKCKYKKECASPLTEPVCVETPPDDKRKKRQSRNLTVANIEPFNIETNVQKPKKKQSRNLNIAPVTIIDIKPKVQPLPVKMVRSRTLPLEMMTPKCSETARYDDTWSRKSDDSSLQLTSFEKRKEYAKTIRKPLSARKSPAVTPDSNSLVGNSTIFFTKNYKNLTLASAQKRKEYGRIIKKRNCRTGTESVCSDKPETGGKSRTLGTRTFVIANVEPRKVPPARPPPPVFQKSGGKHPTSSVSHRKEEKEIMIPPPPPPKSQMGQKAVQNKELRGYQTTTRTERYGYSPFGEHGGGKASGMPTCKELKTAVTKLCGCAPTVTPVDTSYLDLGQHPPLKSEHPPVPTIIKPVSARSDRSKSPKRGTKTSETVQIPQTSTAAYFLLTGNMVPTPFTDQSPFAEARFKPSRVSYSLKPHRQMSVHKSLKIKPKTSTLCITKSKSEYCLSRDNITEKTSKLKRTYKAAKTRNGIGSGTVTTGSTAKKLEKRKISCQSSDNGSVMSDNRRLSEVVVLNKAAKLKMQFRNAQSGSKESGLPKKAEQKGKERNAKQNKNDDSSFDPSLQDIKLMEFISKLSQGDVDLLKSCGVFKNLSFNRSAVLDSKRYTEEPPPVQPKQADSGLMQKQIPNCEQKQVCNPTVMFFKTNDNKQTDKGDKSKHSSLNNETSSSSSTEGVNVFVSDHKSNVVIHVSNSDTSKAEGTSRLSKSKEIPHCKGPCLSSESKSELKYLMKKRSECKQYVADIMKEVKMKQLKKMRSKSVPPKIQKRDIGTQTSVEMIDVSVQISPEKSPEFPPALPTQEDRDFMENLRRKLEPLMTKTATDQSESSMESQKNKVSEVKKEETKEKDLRDETSPSESVIQSKGTRRDSRTQYLKRIKQTDDSETSKASIGEVSGYTTFKNIPNPLEIDQQRRVSFRSGLSEKDKFNNLLDMYNASEDLALKIAREEPMLSVTELKSASDAAASQENLLCKPSDSKRTSILKSEEQQTSKKKSLSKRISSMFLKKIMSRPSSGNVRKRVKASRSNLSTKSRSVEFSESQILKDEESAPKVNQEEERTLKVQDIASTDDVHAKDIKQCFQKGFKPEPTGTSREEACLELATGVEKDKTRRPVVSGSDKQDTFINFSERDTALDFLLALGFSVDEASTAIKDDDVRGRLTAAITEARVWINRITTTQGTLLYLVSYKTRPGIMRYFLQIVEAIINKRIINAVKLDGFLRVLESVEGRSVDIITVLGMDKFDDEQNEEKLVKKQLRKLFVTVFRIAEREAALNNKTLDRKAMALLRILAAKYRAGLHPHLELIAKYIGHGLLKTEVQLEAAMIYLSRLDTEEVKLKEFEQYCGIICDDGRLSK